MLIARVNWHTFVNQRLDRGEVARCRCIGDELPGVRAVSMRTDEQALPDAIRHQQQNHRQDECTEEANANPVRPLPFDRKSYARRNSPNYPNDWTEPKY